MIFLAPDAETEIDDFYSAPIADQDVLELQISVADLAAVKNSDGFCDLLKVHFYHMFRHSAFNRLAFKQLVEALATDVLLDENPVTQISLKRGKKFWKVFRV